jgi:hypothetical protein
MDRFCTTDAHTLRIGYPTARLLRGLDAAERGRISGRAIAVRSDSPYASVRGIAPGTGVTDLRRRLRPADTLRIGRDTWYLARGRARAIFRTRGGVVREVGIADARLTSTPGSARRLLRSWRASVAR